VKEYLEGIVLDVWRFSGRRRASTIVVAHLLNIGGEEDQNV
jgi:hypothetical protein